MEKKCPDDEETERTKEFTKLFNNKNGEELTQLYLKSDAFLLRCVFEKFIKVSVEKFDVNLNLLHCFSLPGSTWQCGLEYTGINLQKFQEKDLILTLENSIRGGISTVLGDRYAKSHENKRNCIRMLLIYTDIL